LVLFNKLTETFREELSKMRKNEKKEDEIWGLELDQMHNFKTYFPNYNPNKLEERFASQLEVTIRANKRATA